MSGDTEKLTPQKQAETAKRDGNCQFVKKNYVEAIKHYSAAIDFVADLQEKTLDVKKLISACYANRAECQIREKAFKKAVDDCTAALKIDDKYVKARFRRAKANEMIRKFKQATEDLQEILKDDPKHKEALKALRRVKKLETGVEYDPETDVTKLDQSRIAGFARANTHRETLVVKLDALRKQLQLAKDAAEAIECVLDDDEEGAFRIKL